MDKGASIWESHLSSFARDVSSSAPTPGGGSVAGVSGCLGIGLIMMAAEVSRNKTEDEGDKALLSQGIERLGGLMEALQLKADEDIEVFDRYMVALRMPKSTDDEKIVRTNALRHAAHAAATVPTEAIQMAYQALSEADELLPLIDKGIVSDLGAGVALVRSSIEANALNVRINLGGIKSEEDRQHFQDVLDQRVPEAQEQADILYDQVVKRLGG